MTVAHIDSQSTYTAIYATSMPRPEKHKVVNLLSIEGVTIPWPEGMTAAEALIEWRSKSLKQFRSDVAKEWKRNG